MIPRETIQTIRERGADDIVEIIEGYVKPLKRTGNKWSGLCPFHEEKTPSFYVTPAMGIYKCFGCGEGGDAIDFLMKVEGYDFMETIKHLAGRFHIHISERKRSRPQKNIKEAVLPGITEWKRQWRKDDRAVLNLTGNPVDSQMGILPPVSRGQFQLIKRYTQNIILNARMYNDEAVWQSLENGIKQGMTLHFLKDGEQIDWMLYFLSDPSVLISVINWIKQIVIRIPDPITYKIYQQELLNYYKNTKN
jgi:hypothetical protein